MARLRTGLLIGQIEKQTWEDLRTSGGYDIHTKPRLTDVIDDRDASWNSVQIEFMRKAHFDFVVTDHSASAKPLVAIEIDGPSHAAPEQKRRDTLKDDICRSAGLTLWRFGPLGLPNRISVDRTAEIPRARVHSGAAARSRACGCAPRPWTPRRIQTR